MKTPTIQLGKHTVSENSPCHVIAEIGINHGGDFETAKRLIAAAAQAGADSVKFQTYVTEKRVKAGSPIFDILKKCELSFDQQAKLKTFAESELGVTFFSTPFDDESVDFLASVGVDLFKVASFDSVNLSLLRRVAKTGKPVIMSTGMSNVDEVGRALEVLGASPTALLHCVSSYPTPLPEANLRAIHFLKRKYPEHVIGYSDHTIGSEAPALAVAAGAKILEKHFTLDSTLPGPDHSLSADPKVMAEMISRVREVEGILGDAKLALREIESPIAQYRRPTQ